MGTRERSTARQWWRVWQSRGSSTQPHTSYRPSSKTSSQSSTSPYWSDSLFCLWASYQSRDWSVHPAPTSPYPHANVSYRANCSTRARRRAHTQKLRMHLRVGIGRCSRRQMRCVSQVTQPNHQRDNHRQLSWWWNLTLPGLSREVSASHHSSYWSRDRHQSRPWLLHRSRLWWCCLSVSLSYHSCRRGRSSKSSVCPSFFGF